MPGRRTWGRRATVLALLAAAVLAAGIGAPRLALTLAPARLADANALLDALWWPLAGARFLVYAGLAWIVFPARVRARAAVCGRPTPPIGGRCWGVFLALAAGDLLLAQVPYAMLR
jgi:hypothetical protein